MSFFFYLSSTTVVGLLILSSVGIIAFLKYFALVSIGYFVYHYINRKIPQYPHTQVYEMFKANPLHNGKDAVGLVTIVTGSTSGIGQKVAEELFRYGATVIIASRNASKAAAVIDEIVACNPGSKGKLVFGKLDTADLDSVRDFAVWFKKHYNHVDYLVNNAGIQYGGMENSPLTNMAASITSKQGYDVCFVTNYLGHFLLTHLLLPLVRGKVVNVGSSFHFQADGKTLNPALGPDGKTPDAAIGDNKGFKHRAQSYGVTKLANVIHARELQKRLAGYGYPTIKAVSVCPGWVQTNILAKDIMGYIIHSNAYNIQEGILSSMCAIFDKDHKGGEFVTNQIMPLSTYPWFDSFLKTLTSLGIRDQVVLGLATAVLCLQSQSYGYHIHRPSPEADDAQLTAAFYDWTMEELKRKGYITN
jgi:NAD(P)-dependent dehydrogenase (short-subunit alcohol dehydrogenase family)